MAKQKGYKVTRASVTRKWITARDIDVICQAWEKFEGLVEVMEGAIGALLVGRLAGFNALRVVHSWRTLRRYEEILGIRFEDHLSAETPESDRVNGVRYAKKFKAFWKALAAGVGAEEGAREVIGAEKVGTE